jgi:peptidoglycan/LPS O-acetylase OafA/YrhL
VAIFVIIGLFHGQLARPWRSYLYFCCGIVGSLIYLEEPLIAVLRRPIVRNALALPIILLVFYVTDADAVPVLAAFSFFMAITAGFSFFGLLKTKAAIWLGDISYGIYLMHGAFLWITYYLIRSTGRLDSITVPYLFLLTLVVGIGVIAMASASYIFFERPIMRWAKGLTAPAS